MTHDEFLGYVVGGDVDYVTILHLHQGEPVGEPVYEIWVWGSRISRWACNRMRHPSGEVMTFLSEAHALAYVRRCGVTMVEFDATGGMS